MVVHEAIQVHGGWAVVVLDVTDSRTILKEKYSQLFKERVTNNDINSKEQKEMSNEELIQNNELEQKAPIKQIKKKKI